MQFWSFSNIDIAYETSPHKFCFLCQSDSLFFFFHVIMRYINKNIKILKVNEKISLLMTLQRVKFRWEIFWNWLWILSWKEFLDRRGSPDIAQSTSFWSRWGWYRWIDSMGKSLKEVASKATECKHVHLWMTHLEDQNVSKAESHDLYRTVAVEEELYNMFGC